MAALPEQIRDSMRIIWHMTNWCNYSCQYCGVMIFHKKSRAEEKQAHAFDYKSPAEWVEVFRRFPQKEIFLKLTGGEPFLDRDNFREFLEGLTTDERYIMRLDTNASWDPKAFNTFEKRRLQLNVSYHPQEITFEAFQKRIRNIRDAGFPVAMINFVLAPENLDAENKIYQLERDGFFVNVSAMIPMGLYTNWNDRTDREVELLKAYNTPIDLHYRLNNPPTKGRLCYHPAISYYMIWDGQIKIHCGGKLQNIFTEGPPALPREAVPCPLDHCENCVDMYRAILDEPMVQRPVSVFTLADYVDEVMEHRRKNQWKIRFHRLRAMLPRSPAPAANFVPLKAIQTNSSKIDGAFANSNSIEGRSRDRVLLSGWAGSADPGDSLREIRLKVNGDQVAVIRHFTPMSNGNGSSKWGWQAMIYLPTLDAGTFQLGAEAVCASGQSKDLAPLELRILD